MVFDNNGPIINGSQSVSIAMVVAVSHGHHCGYFFSEIAIGISQFFVVAAATVGGFDFPSPKIRLIVVRTFMLVHMEYDFFIKQN